MIYDVFGYSSQVLQGADILASRGYCVFMPDFFKGQPAPLSWMPMPDESGKEPTADEESLDKFCEGPGNTDRMKEKVRILVERIQTTQPAITKWGLIGYCWGGYVSNFLLGASSPFSACVQLHAGWPGKEIAESVIVPILALNSKDEPETQYAHFKPHLKVEARFEHFPTMLHGWMSARGDLQKSEVLKAFQKGYDMLVEWFDRFL